MISRRWTDDDLDKLRTLVASGASALRASAALKRRKSIVRIKARELGVPFPTDAEMRAKRRSTFELANRS
jgi:hypothetical protein